jgi:hypothetical protein
MEHLLREEQKSENKNPGSKMSLKLDELRKRLLQQPPPDVTGGPPSDTPAPSRLADTGGATLEAKDPAPRITEPLAVKIAEIAAANVVSMEAPLAAKREDYAAPPPARRNAPPNMKGSVTQDQLADAVAKVFEETKNFEGRLDELGRMFSLVEQVGGSAEELFSPLRAFYTQLSQLAHSFEPMRAFQAQLAQMAETFEPMKVLHDQLALVADSFREHLELLVRALQPATEFRERIVRLAATFDQAAELQEQFRELYSAFNASGDDAEESHPADGNGRRATFH